MPIESSYFQLRPERVKTLIHGQGLKKYWVADECGVHKTTLRRWLSGRIVKVRRGNIERLAQVLTTPSTEFACAWKPSTEAASTTC